MTAENTDEIQKKMDELVEQADLIIANPDTINSLRKRGIPFESEHLSFDEYVERVVEKRAQGAKKLAGQLPVLNPKIANATLKALYDEMCESFMLGFFGSAITSSVILFELAVKYCLYAFRRQGDPNARWDEIEKLDLLAAVNQLPGKCVNKDEKKKLNQYINDVRNPYIHYNIKKLIKDLIITRLPSLNTDTGEITIHRNVHASSNEALWFSAKQFLDKNTAILHLRFAVDWANRLLQPET